MSLFTGNIGNGLVSNPKDVKRLRGILNNRGYRDTNSDFEYVDNTLDNNIKKFQRDNNLRIDGNIKPDNETEKEIVKQDVLSRRIEELEKIKKDIIIEEGKELKEWSKKGKIGGAVVGAVIGQRIKAPKKGAKAGAWLGLGIGATGAKIKDVITTSDLEKQEKLLVREIKKMKETQK